MVESETVRTETIGQEERELPPCWIRLEPRRATASSAPESGVLESLPGKSPLREQLIETVSRAKEVLVLSSFLYADPGLEGAVLDAARRGVRVYVLTASENRLRIETKLDGEVDARRFEEHSRLLNGLAGKVLVRTGEDLHAKFVVADPFGSRPVGVLSTANFTTDALGGHEELGVRLEPDEAKDLGKLFLHGFWSQSQHELLQPGRLLEVQPLAPGPHPNSLPYTAKGSTHLRSAVIEALERSKGPLLLASFGFDKDHESVKCIEQASRSGRTVRVLTRRRDNPSQVDAVNSMARAGAQIHAFDHLHAKAIAWGTDEEPRALVMTANFAKLGLDQGFEAGVLLDRKRALGVKGILEAWWKRATWEFRAGMKRREVLGEIQLWEGGRLIRAQVKEESPAVNLGAIKASSAESAARARPSMFPDPPPVGGLPTLYHRNVYTWSVSVTEGDPGAHRASDRKGRAQP